MYLSFEFCPFKVSHNQELPVIVEREVMLERSLINTIEEEEEVSPGR